MLVPKLSGTADKPCDVLPACEEGACCAETTPGTGLMASHMYTLSLKKFTSSKHSIKNLFWCTLQSVLAYFKVKSHTLKYGLTSTVPKVYQKYTFRTSSKVFWSPALQCCLGGPKSGSKFTKSTFVYFKVNKSVIKVHMFTLKYTKSTLVYF